jgi:UDP-N-acetylglucosamine diphosphorylase/glucosamine-1-phosphate N-acetyltransferase
MVINVILIEEDAVEELYPFALTCNTWQIRAGRHTIHERWVRALPDANVVVHTHRTLHEQVYREQIAGGVLGRPAPMLVLLSSAVLSPEHMKGLAERTLSAKRPCVITSDAATIGAIVPTTPDRLDEIMAVLDDVAATDADLVSVPSRHVRRMWDVLDMIDDAIAWDAELSDSCVSPTAVIHPSAIIDESKGTVLIDDMAEIGPMAVIQGPCSIGAHAVVKPHAHITHSVIGPYCKVGGEISVSIFQAYSNKQHYGFVGHSIIGQWVNLGAGTTTSNLKNTYHDVRPTMPWGRETSGRLFLGSMIGDFTRTAIGTMLPTGGVYGVCSHVMSEGLAPSNVRSFVWQAGVAYDRSHAFDTCDAMMQRRGHTLSERHRELLDDVRERDV